MSKIEIVMKLFEIGAIKFGNFVMKTGSTSPIYIDLRCIVSHPDLLKMISQKIWQIKLASEIDVDAICGVPYTALPIAAALSVTENIPMIMKRKEPKLYGTKKFIEGTYEKGTKCLIIEDIVTSGSSVLETVEVLRKEGILVTDCIVVMDRQQGGKENLSKVGIKLHSLFLIRNVLNLLQDHSVCPQIDVENALRYLNENSHIDINLKNDDTLNDTHLTLNPLSEILRTIIRQKKSNLCLAADVETSEELLKLADIVGPYICILKTHVDILVDFSENLPSMLRKLAKKHNYLIMEDRKFADIGNSVIHQYRSGLFKIQDWADIVTVHSLPGEGVIEALKISSVGNKGCVLVAQMSTKGALTSKQYVEETIKIAEKHKDFVLGFISQEKISSNHFIYMCPGINISCTSDNLGQQYRSPKDAILKDGIDIVIVGRGIISSENIEQVAKKFRDESFVAYESKSNN